MKTEYVVSPASAGSVEIKDGKLVLTVVEGGVVTTSAVNVTSSVPGTDYGSEIAVAMGKPPTTDDPNAWWNKPQTGEKETREKISLTNGSHYNFSADVSRKVIELTRPADQVAVQLHVKAVKDGVVRIQLAGNSVVGGAAVGVNGNFSGKIAEGELGAFDYFASVKTGDTVDVSLRLDGGDQMVLFVVIAE